jgi:uncharacterized protein (DUF4415 family)
MTTQRRTRVLKRKGAGTKSWEVVKVVLDDDVETHFRRGGRGWQSRINAALRKVAKLPAAKRKKA